jgi:hypothetical protein
MGTCESCGRTDEVTEKVQRIYLTPPGADAGVAPDGSTADSDATAIPGDIEQWCASCRATFPHVVITEE